MCEPAYLQRLVLSRGLNARDWIATIVWIILHRITGIFSYDRLNIYRDHRDDYLKSKFNHWRQCTAETTYVPIETSKRNEDLENYIVSTAYNYNALSGSALLEGAGERGDEPQVLPENELSNFSSGHRKREKSSCRQKIFGPYLLDLSIQTALHFILKHQGFLKCTLATCNQTQKNTGTVMSLPIRILKWNLTACSFPPSTIMDGSSAQGLPQCIKEEQRVLFH